MTFAGDATQTKQDAIIAKTDNLAGETPSESSTTKNWKTVADSPDGTGGIITTIGAAATRKKVHSLLLDVNALTAASAIEVKLFIKINGIQRKVYEESFVVGTDTDGLWIIDGTLGIHDVLTIAVYSDTDESVAIGYTAMTEAM